MHVEASLVMKPRLERRIVRMLLTTLSKKGFISAPNDDAIDVRHSRAVFESAERTEEQRGTISKTRTRMLADIKDGEPLISEVM